MEETSIQWCHSIVNPVIGCPGWDSFPTPQKVFYRIDQALLPFEVKLNGYALFDRFVSTELADFLRPRKRHRNLVTLSNIWHLREAFGAVVSRDHGDIVGEIVLQNIIVLLNHYSGRIELKREPDIPKLPRPSKKNYAKAFEQTHSFGGRMAKAAGLIDLRGTTDAERPWLDGIPRLIFVSDMGGSLNSKALFRFLSQEAENIASDNGRRHLWLWLSNYPHHMYLFSEMIGGFAGNICAMRTVTCVGSARRVDKLRRIDATCRGLLVEPLRERVSRGKINLKGIDWVIVGGEVANGNLAAPFHLEWAEELLAHCRRNGVSFFLTKIGSNPFWRGKPFPVLESSGGDWNEWPAHLRIRELPEYFRTYKDSGPPVRFDSEFPF